MESVNPKTGVVKPSESKILHMGNEVRFKDPKKSKATSVTNVPGPG